MIVTAGPTREPIDPVRFITNRSSGKMGYAIAESAHRRGAKVTLISGPAAIAPPAGVHLIRVETAAEMLGAVRKELSANSVLVMAAAVSDFRAASVESQKIKKGDRDGISIALERTPDVLASVAEEAKRPFTVAFAAETNALEDNATKKLADKRADMIVANDVSDPAIGFDSDENEVLVIAKDGSRTRIERAPKLVIADRILDLVAERITKA